MNEHKQARDPGLFTESVMQRSVSLRLQALQEVAQGQQAKCHQQHPEGNGAGDAQAGDQDKQQGQDGQQYGNDEGEHFRFGQFDFMTGSYSE